MEDYQEICRPHRELGLKLAHKVKPRHIRIETLGPQTRLLRDLELFPKVPGKLNKNGVREMLVHNETKFNRDDHWFYK